MEFRRVLFRSLLPTTVIALLLLGFSTYWHLQELRTLARAEAQAAALQVAEIATVPLARADLGALQRIASVANQRQGFNHVQIISADGRVLAGAGRPGDADTGTRILTQPIPDRKSTRLNSVTNAQLVCRLLLEKKKAN